MKKIVVKEKNKEEIRIPKETEEERKERLKYWTCTRTQVVESKKKYNRQKYKKFDGADS